MSFEWQFSFGNGKPDENETKPNQKKKCVRIASIVTREYASLPKAKGKGIAEKSVRAQLFAIYFWTKNDARVHALALNK